MENSEFVLKSDDSIYPDVNIGANQTIYMGRTRENNIEDIFVSKKHLKIRTENGKKAIFVELLGINSSVLNGEKMERDREYQAIDGDLIELIPDKYVYKVELKQLQKCETTKRRISDEFDLPLSKHIRLNIDIKKDNNSSKLKPDWESYNDRQLLVYTPKDCKTSSLIAAYDMDGTLIATKSGKVFPTSYDDWKLAYGNVKGILREKYLTNYKIVIFTNQAGITSGKTDTTEIQQKIENVIKALGVPVQAFVATGDNFYRKPMTGMWQALYDLKNDNLPIDMKNSFYVGDAAGRPECKSRKKKKDHSCVDRLFAFNLNLQFYTPEEHFSKAKVEKWTKPEFDPKEYFTKSTQIVHPDFQFAKNEPEVIILVGGPGSGKSFFCKTFLEDAKYEVINRDTIGTWQKCVNRLTDCLKIGKKAVIDNTNGNKEMRLRYINVAKKFNVMCRCFVMTTSFKHCEHNVAFRELIDNKHSRVSKMVLNTYKKHYEVPSRDEGFSEIVNIDFKPKFINEKDENLYKMYLLAS